MAVVVASIVEISKDRVVDKLCVEAFKRYAYDTELDDFEKELRRDLHQRGSALSWDSARVELERSKGIVVERFEHPSPWSMAVTDAAPPVTLNGATGGASPGTFEQPIPGGHYLHQATGSETPRPENPTGYLCSSEDFGEDDDILPIDLVQSAAFGSVGTSQTNAAIPQMMLREAGQDVNRPQYTASEDDFGEDLLDGGTQMAQPMITENEASWQITSQQPWQLGPEHCSLTTLENVAKGLIKFELLKLSTCTTMHVTCTHHQFDELLKEQVGIFGTAQTNAAIAQLFREAYEEIDKPLDKRLSSSLDPIDEFGEDFGEEFSAMASPDSRSSCQVEPEARWQIKSQQPWQHGLEHCTLTIFENIGENLVQFELVKNTSNETMYVTCTNGQFDALLEEQTGLAGGAQMHAAIEQLFNEAHEEMQKPSHEADLDKFGEGELREQAPAASTSARWQIHSQQPLQHSGEPCTLTILENKTEKLIQFELVKHGTDQTMYVTCTNAQFEQLLSEQAVTGTARVDAAILQLFQEAHEEVGSG